jgi:hypothetical protein
LCQKTRINDCNRIAYKRRPGSVKIFDILGRENLPRIRYFQLDQKLTHPVVMIAAQTFLTPQNRQSSVVRPKSLFAGRSGDGVLYRNIKFL